MAQIEQHIHIDISSEQALANTYKEEIETMIRNLVALMNTAVDDGFQTQFQLTNQKDGRYVFNGVKLIKTY